MNVKARLVLAPVASTTPSCTLLKVPAVVGVPLTVMVLPLSEAVRPSASPVAVRPLNGPVPPLTVMLLLKPGWLTVQADDDGAPSVAAGLTVTLNVAADVAPVVS